MLRTFYRQNDYHPVYALRGSLTLLLEIPFFIAAYHFLSNLGALDGASLGRISDLGRPDALIRSGSISINLLPILMLVFNAASAMLYTDKLPNKNRIPVFLSALVFFILLYRSPAGLVYYWTLNNLFSLIRNAVRKVWRTGRPARRIQWQKGRQTEQQTGGQTRLPESSIPHKGNEKTDNSLFILSAILLCLFLGVLIPAGVIASSTGEFVDVNVPRSPLGYIFFCTVLSAGFLIWAGIYHALSRGKGRRFLTQVLVCICFTGIINYMAFHTKSGTLSDLLRFETAQKYTRGENLLNLAVLLAAAGVCIVLYHRCKRVLFAVSLAGILVTVFLSAGSILRIQKGYRTTLETLQDSSEIPPLVFSKEGKNVVVLMADALVSYYIPYMMQERPELLGMFDGFTYYPNTVSFGCQTIYGTPGLYGGYEYTPKEMNLRDTQLLSDKQNEALRVMPVLFHDAGFQVTVCDPTYAGYQEPPDLQIYDDYPKIRVCNTMGKFGYSAQSREAADRIRCRNFFCYSVLKTAPLFLQPVIYNYGNYCSLEYFLTRSDKEDPYAAFGQNRMGLSKASGIDPSFVRQYGVLDNLPAITQTEEENTDHFLMMSNSLPHNPMILKEPEYEPMHTVDNTEYDNTHRIKSAADGSSTDFYDENYPRYQVNMATMLKLGAWFEYLKENEVYDNTRIILVSDHAWRLGDLAGMVKHYGFEVDRNLADGAYQADFSIFNCSLLVKDFGAAGFVTDPVFMTNADVPELALKELIEDPVNPFTGKAIDRSCKENGRAELLMGSNWNIETNKGTQFQPDHWFSVQDNIFDPDNWNYEGFHQ